MGVMILAPVVTGATELAPVDPTPLVETVATGVNDTGSVGQDNQILNPDIDYTDAYVADNGSVVGVLDPSYDPNYDGVTYSASDFEIGSSGEGT